MCPNFPISLILYIPNPFSLRTNGSQIMRIMQLGARVYIKQLRILDGRGALFAAADDVKILGPPEVT